MLDADDLAAELLRLGADARKRLVEEVAERRKRLVREVVGEIRRAHLADMSARQAAREICRAAQGSRIRSVDPVLRGLIAVQLREKLGDLHDLLGEESIRKMTEISMCLDGKE
jgi:hypothetical protein